jgi:dihydroorotate dehydrogenase (fumarate)
MELAMIDLHTSYLGLELKNPLVASASVLSKKLDNIRKMEDAGLSAVVLYSLFEEQIDHESLELDHYLTRGSYTYAEALTYYPDLEKYNMGPEKYLELIRQAKQAVKIPIIASLNGISRGGWIDYACKMQEAGADAIELNIYYLATDKNVPGAYLEGTYVELVKEMNSNLQIPLAVKLSPFFTSLPFFTQRLKEAGAKGLVLFNRFYQPNIDLEELKIAPHLELSSSSDLLLPLRWIAILYGRVSVDFALTSGIHTGEDILKAMMAGAKVAMSASELIANGIPRATTLLEEVKHWMEKHEYTSIHQMQGSLSQQKVEEPGVFERANYMKALNKFDNRFP